MTGQQQRCGAHLRPGIRCERDARHSGFHRKQSSTLKASWLSERSYEIETLTHARKAAKS